MPAIAAVSVSTLPHADLGNSEPNLVNQYLTDLSKTKEGIIVFTASAAGEVSQEFPDMGHGVFTYYMLEGLEGKADL